MDHFCGDRAGWDCISQEEGENGYIFVGLGWRWGWSDHGVDGYESWNPCKTPV